MSMKYAYSDAKKIIKTFINIVMIVVISSAKYLKNC